MEFIIVAAVLVVAGIFCYYLNHRVSEMEKESIEDAQIIGELTAIVVLMRDKMEPLINHTGKTVSKAVEESGLKDIHEVAGEFVDELEKAGIVVVGAVQDISQDKAD